MQATFILDSDELNHAFVDKLKAMFQNKRAELLVTETDDTEYLQASEVNRTKLLDAINNIKQGENLVEADSKLFQ